LEGLLVQVGCFILNSLHMYIYFNVIPTIIKYRYPNRKRKTFNDEQD